MRYAKINKNDIVNGKGVSVSFWAQGCSRRCPGCHNKETWDFNGGKEYNQSVSDEVIEAIGKNGVQRNLSILGGEPLEFRNIPMIYDLVCKTRELYPNIKIYMWTGFKYEDIHTVGSIKMILEQIDYLIDGEFILDQKDITLGYAGSGNQRIIDIKDSLKLDTIVILDTL